LKFTASFTPWDERRAREFFGERPLEDVLRELVAAEECFFVASSAGMVFGLRLRDGSRVALKAIRPRPGLREACEVQTELHARGFPCPRPLLGPVPLGHSYAVVQEWVEALQRDLHDPALRQISAALLAQLVALAPRREGLPPTFVGACAPFPPPHDSRFDFARPDGSWIDEIGATANASRASPREGVVGHSDWSAKNFGWDGDRIAVVYDWPDSAAADAEETIIGQASVNFPATWGLPVAPKFASREESEAFVEEYEEVAGRRLDRDHIAAARLYALAYSARCELSDLDGAAGEVQRRLREEAASF
jgi:hypothetical protein